MAEDTAASEYARMLDLAPAEIRARIRSGAYRGYSWSLAPDYVHTALVCVPRDIALEFMTFTQRNAAACPVLETTDPGVPQLRTLAAGADVRTDLPGYRVYEKGACVAEPSDITAFWRPDLVAFLIGCSGPFEAPMMRAGVRLRHLEEGKIGTDFMTNIPCVPAGRLQGPLAVSMRPIHWSQVARAVQVTSRYPAFHGAPVHIGDPRVIGIDDVSKPWSGDVLDVHEDEVPVFWACSVTPQLVALQAKLDFVITNAPGYMFISDLPSEALATIA